MSPHSRLFRFLPLGVLAASSLSGCGLLVGLNKYTVGDAEGLGGDGSGGNGSGGRGSGGTADGGSSSSGGTTTGCVKNSDCNDDNDCTQDSCSSKKCTFATLDGGTQCDGGVCNGVTGAEKCVRCVDDAAGEQTDTGCPDTAPQCRTTGTATCVGCEKHADCDDNNDCTTDNCTTAGACKYTSLDPGDACADGVCNGVSGAEACGVCFDTDPGAGVDVGCSEGKPLCAGGTECVECISKDDCPDDGFSCTEEICDAGLCKTSSNDSVCADGDDCADICDPANGAAGTGCVQTTEYTSELLTDGSFEDAMTYWTAFNCTVDTAGVCDVLGSDVAAYIVSGGTPFGSTFMRLTASASFFADLYQVVTIPEGTLRLEASGYYRAGVGSGGPSDPDDYLRGAFWDNDLGEYVGDFLYTATPQVQDYDQPSMTTGWTEFSYSIEPSTNFPLTSGSAEYNLAAWTDDSEPTVGYDVDNVSLKAISCQ
jgi:hypothetical protein